MGNLLTIVRSTTKSFVADQVKMISIDPESIKEMGEPILYRPDQKWIFGYKNDELAGFIVYNKTTIVYAYTVKKYRSKGVLKAIYKEIPVQPWKVVSSNDSLQFFLDQGFKIVKSFNICHKLIKE